MNELFESSYLSVMSNENMKLREELQRKDNIINELKEWIKNFTIDSDEWNKLIYDEYGHYGIENAMILDKIEELEKM